MARDPEVVVSDNNPRFNWFFVSASETSVLFVFLVSEIANVLWGEF